MTTSSSATSPCSSPTPPEPGWSISLLHKSPTRTISSKPSLETSRAHTCVLGTLGISEAAASSQGNVAEPPELFQLKCLSPALEARPHLNRNKPSVPQI
jgi:hypothetical protein